MVADMGGRRNNVLSLPVRASVLHAAPMSPRERPGKRASPHPLRALDSVGTHPRLRGRRPGPSARREGGQAAAADCAGARRPRSFHHGVVLRRAPGFHLAGGRVGLSVLVYVRREGGGASDGGGGEGAAALSGGAGVGAESACVRGGQLRVGGGEGGGDDDGFDREVRGENDGQVDDAQEILPLPRARSRDAPQLLLLSLRDSPFHLQQPPRSRSHCHRHHGSPRLPPVPCR
mmetsp:Transcript_4035/g.7733  ORF Transcript_4035/g.7733 Transcript_4035/m.7733 type:complete len:232 (-) Transcript_4035:1504-2199(-)